jgi:Thiamine pyrophosphate enzyme, N-terminal TPP binding domain
VFGNPGTTELPLIDALVDATDIGYVWALQEASAVAMADGYAQAAGRPGVLNLHTAGGLGHGLGNLLNANVSGTPLVVTAGQQDSRHVVKHNSYRDVRHRRHNGNGWHRAAVQHALSDRDRLDSDLADYDSNSGLPLLPVGGAEFVGMRVLFWPWRSTTTERSPRLIQATADAAENLKRN